MKTATPISTLLLVATAATLLAQSDRGTITGTVTDKAGAAVPSAHVTATHISTKIKHETTTTNAGEFSLTSLPVGEYRIAVDSPGFKTSIHQAETLAAGGTLRLDTSLEVGMVQQSVEVTSQNTMLQSD